MKFISKQSNYRVVLRPGQPGSRMAGIPAVSGVYIKFEGGMADISNEEHLKLIWEHPAYLKGDFILSPEDGNDPYSTSRKNIEPDHNMAEMKYGSVGKAINPKPLVEINAEQKEAIAKMAKDMATKMYEDMVKKNEEIKNENVGEVSSIEENVKVEEPKQVVNPTVTLTKNSNLMAPTPIEDESSLAGAQITEADAETMQVDRVDVKDVKVELKTEEGNILNAKHIPDSSTAVPKSKTTGKIKNTK